MLQTSIPSAYIGMRITSFNKLWSFQSSSFWWSLASNDLQNLWWRQLLVDSFWWEWFLWRQLLVIFITSFLQMLSWNSSFHFVDSLALICSSEPMLYLRTLKICLWSCTLEQILAYLSYPNFWSKVLHSYTVWSWIVSNFSVKNSAKRYFKIPHFCSDSDPLLSLSLFFYLLLSFKIPSFINSLLFLILILVLIFIFN